jgi:hypothetical protein
MKYLSWRHRAIATFVLSGFLHACGGGGGTDDSSSTNAVDPVILTALASGEDVSLPIASGGTIAIDQSKAQVQLPANALVDAETGAPVTGTATVTLRVIDPATNPSAMTAGSYEALEDGGTGLIESFGAISVDLSQNDKRLQLAKGQTATIRIPLNSRSGERPITIPLYYWDDAKAYWIKEGSATLKGDASSGFYYEGQVSHFTVWNIDRPIEESVTISGCVKDGKGNLVPVNAFELRSSGLDYSGEALASKPSAGQFKVPMKKGGDAELLLSTGSGNLKAVKIGKQSASTTLDACLVLDATATPLPALSNWEQLVVRLMQGMAAAIVPTAAIDPNADTATLLNAASVCQSGTASNLTLNGKTVLGGESLRQGVAETIGVELNACEPRMLGSVVQSLEGSGGETLAAYTGQAMGELLYTESPLSYSATLTSTLTNLQEINSQVGSNGKFKLSVTQTDSAQGESLTNRILITPVAGASVSNLVSQRKAMFKSGSFLIASDFSAGATESSVFQFKALRYMIGNDEYLLDGQASSLQGTRFTLQKNGQVSAVIRVGSGGWIINGQVDAF